MKRFFSMLVLIGCITVSSCSRVPENHDPVLGAWVRTELTNEATARTSGPAISEEWIFNDVFLGRYNRYSDGQLVFYTDFSWEVVNDIYTISYPDLQAELSSVQVSLKLSQENEMLALKNGEVFAVRK